MNFGGSWYTSRWEPATMAMRRLRERGRMRMRTVPTNVSDMVGGSTDRRRRPPTRVGQTD